MILHMISSQNALKYWWLCTKCHPCAIVIVNSCYSIKYIIFLFCFCYWQRYGPVKIKCRKRDCGIASLQYSISGKFLHSRHWQRLLIFKKQSWNAHNGKVWMVLFLDVVDSVMNFLRFFRLHLTDCSSGFSQHKLLCIQRWFRWEKVPQVFKVNGLSRSLSLFCIDGKSEVPF